MCTDMCIDNCTGICRHAHYVTGMHMCEGMCAGMCVDVCVDMSMGASDLGDFAFCPFLFFNDHCNPTHRRDATQPRRQQQHRNQPATSLPPSFRRPLPAAPHSPPAPPAPPAPAPAPAPAPNRTAPGTQNRDAAADRLRPKAVITQPLVKRLQSTTSPS